MNTKPKRAPSIPQKQTFQRIKTVEAAPVSRGRSKLLKHLAGDILTRTEAITAKCCDCSGYYVDGRIDCSIATCPLYAFMPYRKKDQQG